MADSSGSSSKSGWSRIRGKLQDFSAAATAHQKKSGRDNAQEIDDFLGKTTSNSSDLSATPNDPRPLVPRINTLPSKAPAVQPEWATRPEDLADGKWRPSKPLRLLGLAVTFDDRPAVIGHGGFADDPPSLVRQAKQSAMPQPHSHTGPTTSSENFAIKRKATRASSHPLTPKPAATDDSAPPPHQTPSRHALDPTQPRQPTLPNISVSASQAPSSAAVDIPSQPGSTDSRSGVPLRPAFPSHGESHVDSSREPSPAYPPPTHPLLQVAGLPSDLGNSMTTPTSPSAQRIFEMRAEEGMAHRRSIRSASDVIGPKPGSGHSPASSVSSLEVPAPLTAGVPSADSSRPVSQHSRFASSPEPTAFAESTHYPLRQETSASSSKSHLSPPGSARGFASSQHTLPSYQSVPPRLHSSSSPRLPRTSSVSSPTEASVLQDVAPPPYQHVPAISTSRISTPPPVLAPQIAAEASSSHPAPAEAPVHVAAAKPPGTLAPRPRRPSNRNGLQFMEGQPLPPAPALPSPMPATETSASAAPSGDAISAPIKQGPPAPLRNLAAPETLPPPLQSPPYTASAVPPSYRAVPNVDQSRAHGVTPTRASADNDEAMIQFVEFVSGARNIFNLSGAGDGITHTPLEWQYCALWWLLKGRSGLEEIAREVSPRQADFLGHDTTALAQNHVDLAKAYWIATEILPGILADQLGSPAPSSDVKMAQDTIDAIVKGVTSLCASMKKRNILPPPQYVVSGVDQTIWMSQPFDLYPSEWVYVLNGSPFSKGGHPPSAPALEAFPVSDSRTTYCYGRIFVEAFVGPRNEEPSHPPFKCLLTAIRKVKSPELEITVSSQITQALINVRTNDDVGVHWEHTSFEHDRHCLLIKLPHKVSVWLRLSPRDYAWLWSCFEESQKIARTLRPHSDEHLMQAFDLAAITYRDSANVDQFPDQRMEHCRIAIFERFYKPDEHANRKTHRGYRVAIMTTSKTIRNAQFTVGVKAPLQYASSQTKPEFRLQLNEMDRGRSAILAFHDFESRDFFVDMITGRMLSSKEAVMRSFPVQEVKAGAVKEGVTPEQWTNLRYTQLLVIDEDDPEDPEHELSSCDMSERLRIMMVNGSGTCIDRLCDARMDVRIRVDAGEEGTLQIMRPGAREDLTIAIGPGEGAEGYLRHLFDTATSIASAIAYKFSAVETMHAFERAITGYSVLYDCVPSAFVITRRQMYVGKDKNWPTRNPRVQIVQRDGRVQLLAFFQNYIVADCLNFELKRMDTFEQTTAHKSAAHGMHGMKLVDAKFTLPGSNKDDWLREGAERDATAKYTNLAAEEYAAEHDDILIYFDSEEERDRFGDFLPAPVTKARSKFNLMRRI